MDWHARNRGRRGQAVIETALMAPWIFLLFLGVFDFGFYAYAAIATTNAARVAALYTSSSVAAAGDAATACQYALEELRSLPNVGASKTSCGGVVAVTATPLIDSTDNSTYSLVAVTYQTVPLFPIPGLMGRLTITRTAQMRARVN